tara:strand:- start:308 stop:1837 length:1530 start_codon:yes stop_codon:yes gene_type:complete
MILLIHKDEKVIKITDLDSNQSLSSDSQKPLYVLFDLANQFQNRILIWCHDSLESNLNLEAVKASFVLKNTLLSYANEDYMPEQIGYVEDSSFIKVNKNVKYSTWLVNSFLGSIYSSQLLKFENVINKNESFDFGLNSIAKLGIAQGMFCYSEPNLVKNFNVVEVKKASVFKLFKFVKLHYKGIWSFLLLINFIVNERKFPVIPFLSTLFVKKLSPTLKFDLESLAESSLKKESTIDVVIPTLGRKEHVYNFLKDIENQTHLPNQVVIIEQNGDKNSVSDLDFIQNETWSFKIIHKFINQTGACNARNIALGLIKADYVFLADDDIRIQSDFIASAMSSMRNLSLPAITLSCLGKNDVKSLNRPMQWTAFGSGCSIVESSRLEDVKFDMRYEFGYGEDVDFGVQLRNRGADIVYLPFPEIIHLKASIGGFRTKFVHPWEKDALQPKPSPTVMLNRMQNSTKQQLLGYKTTLFIKYYKQQSVKNPFKYYSRFKKQWRVSEAWANRLSKAV